MDFSDLDALIDALEDSVSSHERGSWRPIWDGIRNITAQFKAVRYPTREDRQHAWDRFQALVAEVKDRQKTEKEEFESRSARSSELKEEILAAAREAVPISLFHEDVDDLLTLGLKSLTRAVLDIDTDERLETLKSCSVRIKEAWALLENNKREMFGRDKSECFDALKDAQERLNEAWQQWKSWQSEQRQRRMEHRKLKRMEFEERVRGRIAGLNERRHRLYGVLAHKESHLDELGEKLSTARSDEFRARVGEWIYEEREAISSIREKLEQIESWIDEEKEKLYDGD
jgi:hypothetical protein